MPKEQLLGEFGGSIAEVSWGPEQYVQLATLNVDAETFIAWCRGIVEEADKAADAERRGITFETKIPHVSDPGRLTSGTSMGMYWSPNRHQINQLIRILRRARNAAYGADE